MNKQFKFTLHSSAEHLLFSGLAWIQSTDSDFAFPYAIEDLTDWPKSREFHPDKDFPFVSRDDLRVCTTHIKIII